jgi:glutathione transport system substrate-binding protein
MALPGTIGYKEFPMYDYNPAKARQLLAEAGFANGITLKMAVVEGWALGKTLEATAALQNYFKDVGITLQVDVLERAAYRAMIAGERESYLAGQMPEFKWHIHFRPWGSDTLFAGDDMQSLYTSTTNINDWYYSNPKVDELILYSVSQAPLADRIKAIEQAQQIMMEDCAGIPLYTGVTFAASSSQLKGFIFQPNGYQYFVESTLIK